MSEPEPTKSTESAEVAPGIRVPWRRALWLGLLGVAGLAFFIFFPIECSKREEDVERFFRLVRAGHRTAALDLTSDALRARLAAPQFPGDPPLDLSERAVAERALLDLIAHSTSESYDGAASGVVTWCFEGSLTAPNGADTNFEIFLVQEDDGWKIDSFDQDDECTSD